MGKGTLSRKNWFYVMAQNTREGQFYQKIWFTVTDRLTFSLRFLQVSSRTTN